MPCIYFVPTEGVLAKHSNQFIGEREVDICFPLGEAPEISYDVEKSEQIAWNGRPCVTKTRENMRMSLISAPMKMTEKPYWVEFVRSTSCGETLRIDTKTLPINCWNVNEQCIVTGTPSIEVIDKIYFSVSFTLLFWNF